MKKTYMRHWGSRYVRSPSGKWYSVHGREGTMVTNRYGTTFFRRGSEVWRDLAVSDRVALERELGRRTKEDLNAENTKFLQWGKLIRTMALQGVSEQNPYTQDLAEMLELMRVQFYAPKIEELSKTLDEIAVTD